MTDAKVVIRVDGGICSQINFVAAGMQIEERIGEKAAVAYDLAWYRECGRDNNGQFVRNWDFPKAFPKMEIPIVGEKVACEYRRRFLLKSDDIGDYVAPCYVSAYPVATEYLIRSADKFRVRFKPDLDSQRQSAVKGMKNCVSCAVHVRRGDMAKGCGLGAPTTIQYYQKALWLVRQMNPATKFFFFSDEPQWVREVLLPQFPQIESAIVSGENESDRGYMDLYVIAQADYVISSVGSLGIYGAILSEKCRTLVMSRKDDAVLTAFPHAICLDCNEHVQATPMRRTGIYKFPYKIWKKIDRFLRT